MGKRNRRRLAGQRASIATQLSAPPGSGSATWGAGWRTINAISMHAVSMYYQWSWPAEDDEQLCPGPPLGGRWP